MLKANGPPRMHGMHRRRRPSGDRKGVHQLIACVCLFVFLSAAAATVSPVRVRLIV
jgi:hypothetical protein